MTEKTNKMKSLVGRKMSKTYKFMGEDITINKLVVAEVIAIQEKAKSSDTDESEGFNVLKTVIQTACPEALELTAEDFNSFPLDELTKLSEEIMRFSGIGANQGK